MNITFTDSVNNVNFNCDQIKCTVESVDSNGFTLIFNSTQSIVKGDIYLTTKNSSQIKFTDGSLWTTYPIKVPDISFMAKGGAFNENVGRSSSELSR